MRHNVQIEGRAALGAASKRLLGKRTNSALRLWSVVRALTVFSGIVKRSSRIQTAIDCNVVLQERYEPSGKDAKHYNQDKRSDHYLSFPAKMIGDAVCF